MSRIVIFIQNNRFLAFIVMLIILLAGMTVVTLLFLDEPPIENSPEVFTPTTVNPKSLYDNTSTPFEYQDTFESNGVEWNFGVKLFDDFELLLPVNNDYFSISKIDERKYLIELDDSFSQSDQAASQFLRQYNLDLGDEQFVIEYITK